MMKTRKISDGYYEVIEGDKWWSVAHREDGGHLIMNSRGQVVKSDGPTGRRIITALLDRSAE